MRLYSSKARVGRNFYHNIVNGEIVVNMQNNDGHDHFKYHYHIKDGELTRVDRSDYKSDTSTETEYGIEERQYKGCWYSKQIQKTIKFKPNSNVAKIFEYTPDNRIEAGEISGFKGKWHRKFVISNGYTSGGSFKSEKFIYDGKVKCKEAYSCYYGKKTATTIRYPDGKVWAVFNGRLQFAYKNDLFKNSRGRYTSGKKWIDTFVPEDCDYSNIFKSDTYDVVVYNAEGKERVKGKVVNRQKVDVWIEDYKEVYYIQGVVVSKKLYYAKPDELDAQDVLDVPNAQLRASLISRIGMGKIIRDLKGKTIHTDEERGNELIELPIRQAKINNWQHGDTIMRVLKVKCPSTNVFYTLRVPPNINTCEEARQWSFGVDRDRRSTEEQAIMNSAEFLPFEKET